MLCLHEGEGVTSRQGDAIPLEWPLEFGPQTEAGVPIKLGWDGKSRAILTSLLTQIQPPPRSRAHAVIGL